MGARRTREMLIRQWRMVELLHSARRGLSVPRIAQELGVVRQTVYRDLDVLAQAGVPLTKENVNGEVRHAFAGHALPPLQLTSLQLAALHLARAQLEPLEGTAMVREIDDLLRRRPSAPRTPAGRATGPGVTAARPKGRRQRAIVSQLDDALRRARRCRILYRGTKASEPAWRVVDPRTFRLADDQLYLVAWCLDRDDWRTFKVARIAQIEVTDTACADHGTFDEKELFAHARKVWSAAPVDVVVRLSPRVGWLADEYPLVTDQVVENRENGEAVVRAKVAGTIEALRWVLAWGADAEVLAPDDLRDSVRDELEAMEATYVRESRKKVSHG